MMATVADPVEAGLNAFLSELTTDERERFLGDVKRVLAEGGTDIGPLLDVLLAWYRLLIARRDPRYRANMEHGTRPLGKTFTLEELKERYKA